MIHRGIICQGDISVVGHSLFNNFRLALTNYFKCNFIDVKQISDLQELHELYIIDEHFQYHKDVWMNNTFIEYLNKNNIEVFIFNFEKIYSSSFPWNIDIQKNVNKINNLTQFVSDIKDFDILNKININKQLLSKDTVLIEPVMDKKDRILFIGQVNDYYPTRRKVLEYIKNNSNLPLDIFITDRKLSYIQFLEKMNEYKFILNPLGTGEFLNLRFYEALKLGCIPIQEVTDKMLSFYPELNYSINFTTPNEISIDIDLNTNTFNYYLEDYFKQILAK